jgi:hypothetical protein
MQELRIQVAGKCSGNTEDCFPAAFNDTAAHPTAAHEGGIRLANATTLQRHILEMRGDAPFVTEGVFHAANAIAVGHVGWLVKGGGTGS